MKEIRQIVDTCSRIDFTHQRAALAMVARVEGSSYRRTGARMLVLDNGTYLGGVSGGCLEGDALRRAQKAIVSNQPSVVTYDTTRDDHHQIGVGLGCNGIIDVLFIPQPVAAIDLLSERMYSRTPRLLATITGGEISSDLLGSAIPFESPEKWSGDFPIPPIAEAVRLDAEQCLAERCTKTITYRLDQKNEVRICLEVLIPSTHLVLYGSNNDIYPMTRIGKELGWDVTIVANPLKLDKSLLVMGVTVLPPAGEVVPDIDSFTAVVLMSHDYNTDFRHFRQVLASRATYIGMLGPRKRAQKMIDALAVEGASIPPENMSRIFAPAGLDIGALTPEEISLSIAAEIRACFAGRDGRSLRLRDVPIHVEHPTSDV
jgi:xanthine/CO dehydrogenase XdhC/CoxF family maturation factor